MLELLQNKNKGYIILCNIVYNFDNSISKLKKYEGNKKNEIKEEKINYYICANTVKIYKKHDRYIQAVANLYEEEKELKNKEKEEENNILFQKIRRKLWRKKQKKKTN